MKIRYDNGDIYEGAIVDNKKHGKGKLTYVNGNFEEGNFVNDKLNGIGKKSI